MSSWKCPKCGSEETYEGTELQQKVSGSGGGPSVGFIGNELGDSGITPMMGTSDKINVRSETVQVSVRKCKKCDTLLGEKDKRYTPQELEQQRLAREKRRDREYKKADRESNSHMLLFAAVLILVTFMTECGFRGGSDGHHHIGFGEYTTYEGYITQREVTRSKWFPWVTICLTPLLLAIPIGLYWDESLKKKQDSKKRSIIPPREAKIPPIIPPREAKKNKAFTVKTLCECGDASAKLTKGNVVEIVGGSEEEREAVRQWVQENHPEYEIS